MLQLTDDEAFSGHDLCHEHVATSSGSGPRSIRYAPYRSRPFLSDIKALVIYLFRRRINAV